MIVMKESDFQKRLIDDIQDKFPGAIVLKNDPKYIQGIPDLTVLYKDHWASLECKKDCKAKIQKNQEYCVDKLNNMSYSSFVYPENKEEVLNEMERVFKSKRKACVPKPK